MELLKEALVSRNILAWAVIILIVVLVLRLLKSATKGFLLLVGAFILILMIQKFFPGFAAPITDFIKAGWFGDQRYIP
jgi:hypothetical protein